MTEQSGRLKSKPALRGSDCRRGPTRTIHVAASGPAQHHGEVMLQPFALDLPGRYVMPSFTLFYMILGYLLITTFQKSRKLTHTKFWLGKSYRILLVTFLGMFFVASLFFIPPTELIKSNSFDFKNPQDYVEGHPPSLEGLNQQSVILAIKTDRILEYDVIPFHMLPLDRGGSQSSIDLLKEIIQDDYDVFIFKQPTTNLENPLLNIFYRKTESK